MWRRACESEHKPVHSSYPSSSSGSVRLISCSSYMSREAFLDHKWLSQLNVCALCLRCPSSSPIWHNSSSSSLETVHRTPWFHFKHLKEGRGVRGYRNGWSVYIDFCVQVTWVPWLLWEFAGWLCCLYLKFLSVFYEKLCFQNSAFNINMDVSSSDYFVNRDSLLRTYN